MKKAAKPKSKEPSKKAVEMLKQLGIPTDGTCLYCQTGEMDEMKAGRLLQDKSSGITVHHYCLLFASGLSQRGKENQGIEGFLPEDIIQEFKRAKRLSCRYCLSKGATIGCVIKRCQMTFHFHCGLDNGALSQFFGNFNSFCFEHRPSQEPDLSCGSPSKSVCPICVSDVPSEPQVNVLKTPCCKNLWLHRECLQRQAISSGYFFRCPVCNNKDDFEKEMKKFGIYIPEQDASWEREDGAFQDLLERHHRCDAEDCLCPNGRTFSKGKKWMIILCGICGSQGCHIKCGGLKNDSKDWACWICCTMVSTEMDSKKKVKSTSSLSKKQLNGPPYKMKLQGKTPRSPLPSNQLLKSSDECNPIFEVKVPTDQGSPVARRAAGVSLPDVPLKPLSWQEITEHECVHQLLGFSQIRKSNRTGSKLELPPMIYNELEELENKRKRALEDSEADEPPVIHKMPKRLCLEFPPMNADHEKKSPLGAKLIQTTLVSKLNDNEISKCSATPKVEDYSDTRSNDLTEVNLLTPTSNEVIVISSDDDSPVSICDMKSSAKVTPCSHLCERHQREAFKFTSNGPPLAKKASSFRLPDDVSFYSYQSKPNPDSGRMDMNGDGSSLFGEMPKLEPVFDQFSSVQMSSNEEKPGTSSSEESAEACPSDIQRMLYTPKKETTISMCIRDSDAGISGPSFKFEWNLSQNSFKNSCNKNVDKAGKRKNPVKKRVKRKNNLRQQVLSTSKDNKNRLVQSTLNHYFSSSSSSGKESPLKIRSSPRLQPTDARATRSSKLKLNRQNRNDVLKIMKKKKKSQRKKDEKNASVTKSSAKKKRSKKAKKRRKSNGGRRSGPDIEYCLNKCLDRSSTDKNDFHHTHLEEKPCTSETSILIGKVPTNAINIFTRLNFDVDDEKDQKTFSIRSKLRGFCPSDSCVPRRSDHLVSITPNNNFNKQTPKLEENKTTEISNLCSFSNEVVSTKIQSQRTPKNCSRPRHFTQYFSESLSKGRYKQRVTMSTSRSEHRFPMSVPKCKSNSYRADVSICDQSGYFRSSEVCCLRKRLRMEDLEGGS
ncbi:uncharacterized protein LOC117106705 [Anneissia japonica]|uniref:uncharacterized protein LOC117106705 n=1 Tax=Anneissia japonica TaxID=1529436 RepID=UPI001425B666|nr:uncharacterized protein LOC117106705 [Anneissia japonica]